MPNAKLGFIACLHLGTVALRAIGDVDLRAQGQTRREAGTQSLRSWIRIAGLPRSSERSALLYVTRRFLDSTDIPWK